MLDWEIERRQKQEGFQQSAALTRRDAVRWQVRFVQRQ